MIKQNPFSLYDFMGYFVPGALLIYIYLLIEFVKANNSFNLIKFLNENDSVQIPKLLFFLIISYSLGHLLNFASSVTVEKYANWKYSYPSKYLLGIKKKDYWEGTGFSNFAKKLIIPIVILPVTVMDFVLGHLFGFKKFYTKKLDDFLIKIIKGNGNKLIKSIYENYLIDEYENGNTELEKELEIDMKEMDFFRIYAHYTFENSKNHQFKLVNYVALYGFLRALTLIAIILFWYIIYFICKYSEFTVNNSSFLIVVAFVSYVFFMAFMKFYRRYTLEGLMLIAIDKELIKKKND
jgi:hypothetical protein